MNITNFTRSALVAIAVVAGSSAAFAQGDIYSRLFDMKAMDRNNDGMVSKQEFLDMMAKAWDMRMEEAKLKGSKMDAAQIKELEKILGRTLSGSAGT